MKKGFRNFCNDDGSTSTLTQTPDETTKHNVVEPSYHGPTTLEEMILQLEIEEDMARKAKARVQPGRMSCVTQSDILRSAHHALSQYPRFSLDGKDSMYRSSFKNSHNPSERKVTRDEKMGRPRHSLLPQTLAGERVVWCKPGVVAKLMGLDAIPIPARKNGATPPTYRDRNSSLVSSMKRQTLRRRAERHDMGRRLSVDRRHVDCSCGSEELRFVP